MARDEKMIHGVVGGAAIEITESGDGTSWIEVMDEDYDGTLGTLPSGTPVETINAVLRMVDKAHAQGVEFGRRVKQQEVLNALGVSEAMRELRAEIEASTDKQMRYIASMPRV
jgi:hypothetical protein